MKSHLSRVWWWFACALITLRGLAFLPEIRLGGYTLRKIDLLAEVRPGDHTTEMPAPDGELASLSLETSIKGEGTSVPLPLPEGLRLPIEDFNRAQDSLSPLRGMQHFYTALAEHKSNPGRKQVRIAVFGDSFIEGDLLTDQLRDTMQQLFGGAGVGFVPIASPLNRSRNTILEYIRGFSNTSAVDTGSAARNGFSLAGQYSRPTEAENEVIYYGVKTHERLRWFHRVRLFYQSASPVRAQWSSTAGQTGSVRLPRASVLGEYLFDLPLEPLCGRFQLSFPCDSNLRLHGLSFESGPGVYVDNFALRGSAGHSIWKTSVEQFQAADSLLHYDLIIVQFGTNVLALGQNDYSHYAPVLRKVLQRLKAGFSEASILVLGVADRSENQDGYYKTMRGLRQLVGIQRQVSQEFGVAFWDLQVAMGGNDSMARLVAKEPPFANKDYTHINRRGGVWLGGLLAKALLHGFEQQQQQHQQQSQRVNPML